MTGGSDGVERLRSFVAVPLPAELQADLLRSARALGSELPAVKWSAKVENLHITLRFLGNVSVAGVEALASALREATAAHESFSVALQGFGAFPDLRRASTLWAGVDDGEGRLGRVAASVEGWSSGWAWARRRRRRRRRMTGRFSRTSRSAAARAASTRGGRSVPGADTASGRWR